MLSFGSFAGISVIWHLAFLLLVIPALIILQRDVWIKKWTKIQRHIYKNEFIRKGQLTHPDSRPRPSAHTFKCHIRLFIVFHFISYLDVVHKNIHRKKWYWALVISIVFKWSAGFVRFILLIFIRLHFQMDDFFPFVLYYFLMNLIVYGFCRTWKIIQPNRSEHSHFIRMIVVREQWTVKNMHLNWLNWNVSLAAISS